MLKSKKIFKTKIGFQAEVIEERLSARQEELALLRKDFSQFTASTAHNFSELAAQYDEIYEALEFLTRKTKQLTEELSTIMKLAREYFDERELNIRGNEALGGATPAEACGFKVEDQDKWKTLIQNASKREKPNSTQS